jgi:hypothetical protein
MEFVVIRVASALKLHLQGKLAVIELSIEAVF